MRDVTSSRASVRRSMPIVSRTNQCAWCRSSVASAASTCEASPAVFRTQVPMSSSFVRSSRIASSSSRAIASGHHDAPAATIGPRPSAGERFRRRDRDGRTARAAVDAHVDMLVAVAGVVDSACERRERDARPRPSADRSCAASASARSFTACANCCGLAWPSMSRHSCARWARTPSTSVQKMSAWSRRMRRLSVRRVRPPVPGSTPSSGTSGRLTAADRSSTRKISSQASASS